MKLDARVCPYCKKKFRPHSSMDKYCGRRCYVAARRKEGWKRCSTTDKSQ